MAIKCMKCRDDKDIHQHHIIPFYLTKEFGIQSNMILLCPKCHQKLHRELYKKIIEATEEFMGYTLEVDECKHNFLKEE